LFFFEDLFFVDFTHEFGESDLELNTLLMIKINLKWNHNQTGLCHTLCELSDFTFGEKEFAGHSVIIVADLFG